MSPRARCCALVLSVFGLFETRAVAQTPASGAAAPPPAAAPLDATQPPASPPPPLPEMAPPLAAPAPPAAAPAPTGPPKLEGPGGTIRLGLLAQAQYQALGSGTADGNTQNLYLRRIRFIVGGTLLKNFEYFFETDYPNLFLANAPVTVTNAATMVTTTTFPKNNPGMNVQDVMITYKALGDMLKIDAGFMLPPLAHNALQSAASLLSWDYFQNTFLSGALFGNATGRDLGVQARGLVADGHVEYRVGMFQGVRNIPVAAAGGAAAEVGGRNFYRLTARAQINFLDPETGFFYGGTYLGAKHILSIGGSFDYQADNYKYWAVDGIVDLPAGPGVATAQVNVAQWNGTGPVVTMAKQTAIMGEAGYLIKQAQVSPIVRYERHSFAEATAGPTETRYVAGLAFWPFGHTSNVKAFYTRIHLNPMTLHDYNQVNLQWQIFFY